MEKKINKDMDDLLITDASVKKLTVNTLFERYMATKNNPCEAVRYAMHSSGKNSLAVGLSPYKTAKKDVLASKLAGRLFSPFCMARSVHKFFTK